MGFFSKVERHSEKATGLSISQIKSFSPEELRTHLENRNGRSLSFVSVFPVIGRGNVLRDRMRSFSQINEFIDNFEQKYFDSEKISWAGRQSFFRFGISFLMGIITDVISSIAVWFITK